MQRVHLRAVKDLDSPRPQFLYVFPKCGMRRMGIISERQRDDGQFFSDRFDEDAESQRVTYSQCPLIDGVERCWRNDDGIRWRKDISRSRFLVVAPHRVTCQAF